MTPDQLLTLKAHIQANVDPAVVSALAGGNHTGLAALYNAQGTKIVWKPSISVAEYRAAIVWAEVDALTIGKARIWEWITGNMKLPIDASVASVRQGLADCWAATASLTALVAIAKRPATKVEEVFVTGVGTNGNPAVLGYEGPVTIHEIGVALR